MTAGYIYAVCRGDDFSNVKAGYTRAPDPIKYCESNYKRVFHPLNIIRTSRVANAKLAESMLFEILKPHRKDVKHEIFGLSDITVLDVAFERVLGFFHAKEDANIDMIVKDLVAGIMGRVVMRKKTKKAVPHMSTEPGIMRTDIRKWFLSAIEAGTLPSKILSQGLADSINSSLSWDLSPKMLFQLIEPYVTTPSSGIAHLFGIRVGRKTGHGYRFLNTNLEAFLREQVR